MERVWRATMLAATISGLLAASAIADGSYDAFDAQTLNPLDAQSQEIPFTSATTVVTPTFDTATYATQGGESGPAAGPQCGASDGEHYGGKTAWVRFNPGVDGELEATAITASYDSIIWLHSAAKVSFGFESLSDLGPADCNDSVLGAGDERVASSVVHITADRVYYLRTAGRCSVSPPCDGNAAAGQTAIRVRFFPSSTGCTSGCTGGGTPPPPGGSAMPFPMRRIGVGINDTDISTKSLVVDLYLNWPTGTQYVFVSNQSTVGFQRRSVSDLAGGVWKSWRLDPISGFQGQRRVHVYFAGPGVDDTRNYDDEIDVDLRAPVIKRAEAGRLVNGRYALSLRATDNLSGVDSFEVLGAKGKILRKRLPVCHLPATKKGVCRNVTPPVLILPIGKRPIRVIATDRALNASKSYAVRTGSCTGGGHVPLPSGRSACVQRGTRCTPALKRYYKAAGWKCVGGQLRRL
jgi:hypothetical protein